MLGETLCEGLVSRSWDGVNLVDPVAIIGDDKNDVVDCGGGIRRWVLVGEGRFVPVRDGLNAEVQADPSNRQNTAVVVMVVVVRARRCFILQGVEWRG